MFPHAWFAANVQAPGQIPTAPGAATFLAIVFGVRVFRVLVKTAFVRVCVRLRDTILAVFENTRLKLLAVGVFTETSFFFGGDRVISGVVRMSVVVPN